MFDNSREVRVNGRTHTRTLAEMKVRREKWDRRFIDLMKVAEGWSKDPSTKVGAVIVRPDLTVASIGYNGFPRGMSDDDALYANRPTKYSRIVHGEMNAILNAHGSVEGCTLYVPFPPCDRCAVHVVQAGIRRVVYVEPTDDIKSRWGEAFIQTAAIFEDAGIEVTVLPAELQAEGFVSNLADVPAYPKLKIIVEMPSLDGEQIIGGGHTIDLDFLASQSDISTNEARLNFTRGLLQRLGEMNLGEVSA
jgi:dCMP deaminase